LAGVQAGEQMLHYINNRKGAHKIGMLRLSKGTHSTDEREEGFSKTMKENGLDISFDAYLGLTYGGAARSAHDLRQQFQNLDALFTPNESTTLGVLHELSDLPADKRPLHIGFDLTPVIADAIREGKMAGVVVQQPQRIGYLAVQAAVAARTGKAVTDFTFTDIAFVTRENLAEFEKIYFKIRE
jgi:ribose transport system substrate-binding protein